MKVTIENHRGLLRLRWNDGTRRSLPLGIAESPVGRSLALQKKAQIELDWQIGHYDRSLLKYRPQTFGKTATEISAPELFDRFTKHQTRAKGLSQSSIDTRYIPLRRSLEKHLNLPANTIGKRQAEEFADVCADTLQAGTAKARIWLLTSCWDWAKDKYQVVENNPWQGLATRFRAEPVQKVKPFTADEVRAIIAGFRSSKYYSPYADFVDFIFGTGCRFGEAVGLRWKHVAVDFQTVWIGQSISKGIVGSTKTKRARTVNLSPSMAALLKRRKADPQCDPDGLVFVTPHGLPIDNHNFRRRAWKQVLNAVGVAYRKPYATRATAVSHSLASGVNYIAVAEATGHDPHTMHKHYASSIDKKPVFVDFHNL
jgi:integrase